MQFRKNPLVKFTIILCALAAGSAQSGTTVDVSYGEVERLGQRILFELEVRNNSAAAIYDVTLESDQVAVPIRHAVIESGKTAVSMTEIYVDPDEEPSSIIWTVGFADALGQYAQETVE